MSKIYSMSKIYLFTQNRWGKGRGREGRGGKEGKVPGWKKNDKIYFQFEKYKPIILALDLTG